MSQKILNYLKTNTLAIILLVCSFAGIYASLYLTMETFHVAENASYQPTCTIDATIDCLSVMKSEYSESFGIPNPLFGIIFYSAFMAFAFILLLHNSGNVSIRTFRLGILPTIGGFFFSYYLLWRSIFFIGKVCPWCLVSCLAATNIFFIMMMFGFKKYSKYIMLLAYFWNLILIAYLVTNYPGLLKFHFI